ncbi:hypothetical protein R3P38DRAFT_2882196 [Favolaschia claudopus]|uniref:Uncharacterized protein n=1 Tax=Favolaschia claudopus TaxID=2862362 RepID=A0AAW0CYI1_9AGAR
MSPAPTPTTPTPAPLEPRVTIPPTATSGIAASNEITESHSHRPAPTHALKSNREHKAPVGLIVGVAVGILAFLFALFFIRWLFIRRARRRAAFAGPGKTLGGANMNPNTKQAPAESRPSIAKDPMPMSMPMPVPTDRDAVELASYPPPSQPNAPQQPTHNPSGSWPTSFAAGEPGPTSSPAARQAYIAAELRAAQALLERGGKGVDVKATKARIRELEQRQGSAWALGLE